jgi:polysaccharide export outer membrane protein
MNRLLLSTLFGLCACYTPHGVFIEVATFAERGGDEYLIAAGDLLQVSVFGQESMSARVRVRPDGRVSLPLVNEVTALGKSPRQLGIELELKLKDFVNKPSVRVSLEESRALTVSVMGEVLKPGTVTLEPNAGVLQALAAGGGFSDFAHRDGIFVLRPSGVATPTRVRFTWTALTRGEGHATTFRLTPGDVVVVE